MQPYGRHSKRGNKIHPADECGICGEHSEHTKGSRRQKDKQALKKETEDAMSEDGYRDMGGASKAGG